MIIGHTYEKASVSSNAERFAASIAITPETFSILIDGIYKDKELAASREPLFNAVDAHTVAGNQHLPIVIHSPTDLEPYYSVRDFGPGMDYNMVTQTFMMLGCSTKRDSNDLIGAKGIGSKAPLCVTDMFSVVSIQNGKRSTYSVIKNAGIPEVVPLNETNTVEADGVEIRFNVDPARTALYRRAIVKCLRYAKFPYEINDPFVTSEIKDRTYPVQYTYTDKESGWTLEMYASVSNNADSVVVMGQQPYKSTFLSSNSSWPLMMVSIPIGDCDVDPGREWTIEGNGDRGFGDRLKAFVEEALDKRGNEVVEELRKFSTLHEVQEYMKRVGGYFANRYGSAYIVDRFKEHAFSNKIEDCVTYGGTGQKRKTGESYDYSMILNGYPLVIDDDSGKNIRSRCNYLAEKRGRRVYVARASDAGTFLDDPFFAGLVYPLSELEKRPVEKRTYGGYGYYEPGHKVWMINQDGAVSSERISRADFRNIKVAMIYRGGASKGDCPLGSVGRLEYYHNQSNTFLKDLGVTENCIFIVPFNRANWLEDDVRVITEDELYEIEKPGLYDYHLSVQAAQSSYKDVVRELNALGVTVKEVPKYRRKVNMAGCLDNVEGYYEAQSKAQRIMSSRKRIGRKLIGSIKSRYPLLDYISVSHYNTPEVLEYRQFIDSKGDKK